jgi:chromosome segregation ATPase
VKETVRSFRSVAILLALVTTPLIFATSVQSQTPASDETTRTFIGELRQLRIAIENLASANSRIQILSLRAGQQEQRLSSLTNQLAPMRLQVAEASSEISIQTEQMRDLEDRLRVQADPKLRQQIELELLARRLSLNSTLMRHAALQAEVDLLTQEAMRENSRLTEIQQRLDDLERVLSSPR